jgi:hypothetical protein
VEFSKRPWREIFRVEIAPAKKLSINCQQLVTESLHERHLPETEKCSIMSALKINQTALTTRLKMKNEKLVSMAALLIASLTAAQAQFTAGDLVVLEAGDGSQTLTNTGNQIILDEFNPTTPNVLVTSFAIPDTGSSSLIVSGTAASEGQLSLSANNQYLVFGGYNVPVGGSLNLAGSSTTAAQVPRAIGTVDASGNYTLGPVTTTFYGGNNMRGGASDGNGNFWGAGAASGTIYMGTGTAAQIQTANANTLAIQDIGGNLFFSTGKTTQGIYEIAGAPTSGTATPSLLIGVSNPSDFTFNSSMTIAYVTVTSGSGKGIQRWNYNGSAWALAYTLDSTTAMNGLAVDFSGDNPIVYATTEAGTSLIEITDTGASSTASTLATAGSNEVFLGLDFAPQAVPEPSALALTGLGLTGLIAFRRRSRKS